MRLVSCVIYLRMATNIQICCGLGNLAPEITAFQRNAVQATLDNVFGVPSQSEWHLRQESAITTSSMDGEQLQLPQQQTVYGELGTGALTKILDAVGVYDGDCFLDIGTGDGMLVMAAALLWPKHLKQSVGLEILPSLYERSLAYKSKLDLMLQNDLSENNTFCPIEFYLGDIYHLNSAKYSANDQRLQKIQDILDTTTIALCFATTWSSGMPKRRLKNLSEALGASMTAKSRVVIIDGTLDSEDGFEYKGELRIFCPDTAPYSTAHLYVKK